MVEVHYPHGDIYRGPYHDNMMNGEGEYTFHNGTKFVGKFRDNYISEGRFQYCNSEVYVGSVDKKNKRQGYGVYKYENGDEYRGAWINGKCHGEGSLTTAKESFEGTWV